MLTQHYQTITTIKEIYFTTCIIKMRSCEYFKAQQRQILILWSWWLEILILRSWWPKILILRPWWRSESPKREKLALVLKSKTFLWYSERPGYMMESLIKIPDDKYRYLFILTIYIDALIYWINIFFIDFDLLSFLLFLFLCVCLFTTHCTYMQLTE